MTHSTNPSDAAVRQQAINPRQSYLVQAPAGSGKTELLTDRILALLAVVERPEEVVAITFTKKAAAEMHARVLEKLHRANEPRPTEPYRQASWDLAQAARARDLEKGWELLEYPARLSIRTIDSLCAHLVRAMPWASGLGGVPAIAEDPNSHYEAAALEALMQVDHEAAVQRLLRHLDVNLSVAQQLLATMLGNRDQWQPVLGDASSLSELEGSLQHLIESQLQTVQAAMPLGWASDLAPIIRLAAANLTQHSKPNSPQLEPLQDWSGTPLSAQISALPQWRGLAQALLTGKGEARKRLTVNEGFPARSAEKDAMQDWLEAHANDPRWVEALSRVMHLPEGYTAEQIEVLFDFIYVLWLAIFQLQKRFAQHNEVDFIEISQRALLALGSAEVPTELLLKVDRSIRHLLVDEFQDTSLTQLQLLERLTAGWEPDDGRTVFLVGDPMQSIYRFRKAEVGLFLQIRENAALGSVSLTPLTLTNNFRSQAGLVDWVNRLGYHLFPSHSNVEFGAVHYSPSEAFQPINTHVAACSFHPICLPASSMDDNAYQRDAQLKLHADLQVVALCKEVLARYPDSAFPMAILVRSRSHLNNVVRQLSVHGVPCRAVELESLSDRPVVQDLLQLIRALYHPADRMAWLALLRSPLVGLRLTTLHSLCAAEPYQTIPSLLEAEIQQPQLDLEDDERQRLHAAAHVLLEANNHSGILPLAAWVERIWHALGGKAVYVDTADQADAEQVLQLLEQIGPYTQLCLEQLEQRVAALKAVPTTTEVAVEVMTIHKAKGLEFEGVLLYGLERKARADDAPLIRLEHHQGRLVLGPIKAYSSDEHDPVSNFLSQREAQRAEHEVKRLLYVAATRARSELHVVASVGLDNNGTFKAPSKGTLLAHIWDCLPMPDVAVPTDSLAEVASGTVAAKLKRVRHMQARPQTWHWPSLSRSTWQWPVSTLDESAMGVVAHAWLERIARDGVGQWTTQRLQDSEHAMRNQLLRAGIDPNTVSDQVAALQQTLIATLGSEQGRWLLSVAKAYREWSLLDIHGRVSVIDLAIAQDDHWLIVDYKTTLPGEGESLTEFAERMRARYSEQMQRYIDQVAQFDQRPVRTALYFPRVDLWVEYTSHDHVAELAALQAAAQPTQASLF
ncbi:MAG TPA: UvrD-helicase domain-containing protein [Candidatus Paenalcaligenes intestinipullorum]|uniref:DNA 3'-5' helicase n=1 Tax=Candidatus Paenalcaligenes intestinipullorum TaxID=2838718 RepID=A0A9D2U7H8_9BURK|nr:UvrD-helicase domain-containing protein [Candidatus Paenalcaligenes intestinipullorum]